jgi:hypothetical protein
VKNAQTARTPRQRLTLLVGIGVVLALGFGGFRYFSESTKYRDPLDRLAERQKQLSLMGVRLEGEELDFTQAEFVSQFSEFDFRKAGADAVENSDIAQKLLSDGEILDKLKRGQTEKRPLFKPSVNDYLLKQNSIATKRASSSLRSYVVTAIAENRVEDAIKASELLFAIQENLIQDPSEEIQVFWFGLNTDLVKNIFTISQMNGLSQSQRERLAAMIRPDAKTITLRELAAKQCSEMVALTRQADHLNDELISVLLSATEGNEPPPTVTKKEVRDAMESELLEAWSEVISAYHEEGDPEQVGYEMDAVSHRRSNQVMDYETEYMLLAMPILFEQFGRMTMRVLQARAAVYLQINDQLRAGEQIVRMSGVDVKLKIEDKGDQWVISTPIADQSDDYNLVSGLEINQHLGVRLFVDKG